MSKVGLGHLDKVEAREFMGLLRLSGWGSNPTTGWKNWFQPVKDTRDTYDFLQEHPDGIVAPVVLPFRVVNVFPGHGEKEVVIREIDGNKPISLPIPVLEPSQTEIDHFTRFIPGPGVIKLLKEASTNEKAGERGAPAGVSFSKHLGSIDIPFGCATWSHPTRAKRIDFYLEVDVVGVQDVEHAVSDCLKQSGIATAVALLLTPLGWAEAIPTFTALMKACLALKLKDIVQVAVQTQSHCL
jgi:hypothetical protein